jgi:rhamnogalacturonyl hydrolase YesR
MMKKLLSLCCAAILAFPVSAQPTADEVMQVTRLANDYFMSKYSDPTVPTNVKRVRPSSLWTRAVYYEGLMALYDIDPQQRYLDYTDKWASFHKWTPRNGITTNDADDQCCEQTYLMRFEKVGDSTMIRPTIANLQHQMKTPNTKKPEAEGALCGWWTWIDAIQMAMPVYMHMYKLTGDVRYRDHGMDMYVWSRDTLAGGLLNKKSGLWWRDKDYVPPYKEPDGQDCYWSRGNGWVYAALVRCMNQLPAKDKVYKRLKKDFLLMTKGVVATQREDGFWNPSLASSNYAMPETSGTALFLYGLCWGMNQGYLKVKDYKPIADRAWQAMVKTAVHRDGFLGWMQGTGKDPSAGQPLSYDKVPDFEDYGTGCFLLGATEYYKLLNK